MKLKQIYGNFSMLTEDVRQFLVEEKWKNAGEIDFRIIKARKNKKIIADSHFRENTSGSIQK